MKISSRRHHRASAAGLIAALCFLGAAALPTGAAERGLPSRSTVAAAETEARVIVKFKADSALMRAQSASGTQAAPQHAQALAARLGLSLTDGRAIASRLQLVKGSGLSSQELADRLAAQSDVEYAVVDGRKRALAAPSDPLYGTQTSATPAAGQWYLQTPGTTLVSAINAEKAWGITTGKSSIVVADLDTGVRFDHPDLTSKLLPGYDFIHDAGTANDGGARDTDPSDPGDYVTSADVGVVAGCTSSDIGNSSWHGTETAGLIGAATNNGVGMASIGRDVMVLPLRVLGKCGGYDSDILGAMYYAGGLTNATYTSGVPANPNPARVINMSLGSAGTCSAAYQDAVNQLTVAGVVVVISAGNDGLTVGTPANCSGVVAVAGVRHSGTKVGYSDLGTAVTISAPAGNCVNTSGTCLYPILTTSNTGTTTPVAGAAGAKYTSGGSDASLGTSFSAPLVSGTVALMLSANASLTPAQVISALKSTARAFPSTGAGAGVSACTAPTSTAQTSECYCTTSTCGAGLLDAGLAVAAVATVTANIAVASTSAVVGTAVTLDGSSSSGTGSNTVASYLWAITSGSELASITSSTSASTATLMPTAAGTVVVSLTVTDSAGNTNTTSTTLTVVAASVVTPPATSSGGGGAMELGWLLGWLASVVGVWVVTPRSRGR